MTTREAEKTAHSARRSRSPKPEEKLVTDPDVNKWKYQAEYFVKALEPAKDAWLERFGMGLSAETVRSSGNIWSTDNDPGGKNLPEEFPDDFIRIEVPDDGKFLVKNTPAAIDKLLKSAPRAFAKPGNAPTGKVSVPRAPKELDTAKLIQQFKAEIDETQQDLERGRPEDKEFLREKLKAAKENLASAEEATKERARA